MNSVKYSIIIPHYNTPDLLERCVSSIPLSDDYQVIIVDDNSPNSKDYFEKYDFLKRKNITLILTTEGLGSGHARNVGIKKAIGKWIIFSDADDYFIPNLSTILDKYYNLEADIVFLGAKCVMADDTSKISPRGKVNRIKRYVQDKDLLKLAYMYTEPWGKIYRNEYIKNNDFLFDETPVCNDQFFSIQTQFSTNKICVYDDPIYVYLSRPGSLSFGQKDSLEKKFIRFNVSVRVLNYIQSKGYKVFPSPTTYFLLRAKNLSEFSYYLKTLHKNKISVIREIFTAIKRAIYVQKQKIRNIKTSDEIKIKKI